MNQDRNRFQPPAWINKFLKWRLPKDQLEEVQGDMQELYKHWVEEMGTRKAKWQYFLNAFTFLRPLPRRKTSFQIKINQPSSLHPYMLHNYLKIAWRNLTKNNVYSFINISGLAVGMAVAILNILWIWDELSFNTYHQNYDRIAQVMKRGIDQDRYFIGRSLQYPLIDELKTSYGSNFKHIVAATQAQDYILTAGEKKISQKGQFIEAEAPQMLTLHMLAGSRQGLNSPNSILLSASTAKALFGNQNPVGQLLKINTDMDVQVTGVYEDLPHNTEFEQVKFFAPWQLAMSENPWMKQQGWKEHFLFIYVQIAPTASFEKVNERINQAELNVIKHLDNMEKHVSWKPQIFLHPMSKWHLYSDFEDGVVQRGPVRFVWMVGLIGGFVLLLACINFMNLSTARSEKRAKEVGIRKTLGCLRKQLISQFLGESYLVVIIAFAFALLLTSLSMPWFNELADKHIHMPWINPYFWGASLLFTLITGLLAGSYPALYLSSFHPLKALKGTFRAA